MKAIIVAAGQGNRLWPLTNDTPKCLLKVGRMSILKWQLEVLNQCHVTDVVLVRGYKREMFRLPKIKYYDNTDYANNNILASLFYAEAEMDDAFIFSYSDILYKASVLQALMKSPGDINLVVDVDWAKHYQRRLLHPIQEAELVTAEGDRVTQIGKGIASPDEARGEFIGLAMFSQRGAAILRDHYHRLLRTYRYMPETQFQRAHSFQNAYLTDMIQELIDHRETVRTVDICGCWMEIDTIEDLDRARREWRK